MVLDRFGSYSPTLEHDIEMDNCLLSLSVVWMSLLFLVSSSYVCIFGISESIKLSESGRHCDGQFCRLEKMAVCRASLPGAVGNHQPYSVLILFLSYIVVWTLVVRIGRQSENPGLLSTVDET